MAQFLSKPSVRVLNVTEETALRYAEVDVHLRRKGRPIPRNDVWIAAVALEHIQREELVDRERFELTTSSMPWKCAPNCATGPRGYLSRI